ncbi:hypothetical protein [Actinocorallia aurantiaca]|uniref:SnoaL-like domain-containing protein n=1 Tax=Actinocorallia aurantiaca TaxID=46204 RepID=A0ABN3U776_9ACTN
MELQEVIKEHTGLSRKALEYGLTTKRLVDGAKSPGFSTADWAPLAELVAVDEFERIGNFKEVMNWQEYVEFLTGWATSADWECSFKRVTEKPGLVFLELEERSRIGDYKSIVNSVSVYEFNEAGKIRHIDVYLQMALPGNDMLKSYEGVQISE